MRNKVGTRSLTVFVDSQNQEIGVMYRQFGGYPSGHGQALVDWAQDRVLVNGIGSDRDVWNGMNCLAADCVSHFKKEAGGFYLHPAGTRGRGEEFTYILYPDPKWDPFVLNTNRDSGRLFIRVLAYGDEIYNGPMSGFDPDTVEEGMDDE